jgi:hypothetical protein
VALKTSFTDCEETPLKEVVLIKVKPEPLAGAAHLSPVASALSATILQEQSQRIVLNY